MDVDWLQGLGVLAQCDGHHFGQIPVQLRRQMRQVVIRKVKGFGSIRMKFGPERSGIRRCLTCHDEVAIHGGNDLPVLEVTLPLSCLSGVFHEGFNRDDFSGDGRHGNVASAAGLFPVLVFGSGGFRQRHGTGDE